MPELPEVERARAAIEAAGLGRRIVDVDDTDTYECRPHAPGEIRAALLGRRLTAAHRRGKSMWCDTSGTGRSRTPGPVLGLHLGMAGRIVITRSATEADTVDTVEGGDPRPRRALLGHEGGVRVPVRGAFLSPRTWVRLPNGDHVIVADVLADTVHTANSRHVPRPPRTVGIVECRPAQLPQKLPPGGRFNLARLTQ